jgi:RND family efflux transporter MFP subunit
MDNKRQILWIIPPILAGVAVLFMLAGNRQLPVRVEVEEPARIVRTIEVHRMDVNPVAEGYGVVQPARVWTAVAQVAGRVVEMHPRLRDGEILPAGTPLFRIDPVDYQLALAQLEAELAELDVQAKNTADLLAIERRNLELARREAQRLNDLAAKGTTSRSNADDAERAMLTSRTAVQNLDNTLALLPSRRKVVEARLEQARRDLEHTAVSAPFDLRVAALDMEVDQYVTTGQRLFEGDSVDRSEVVAQVAISSLRNLFLGRGDQAPDPAVLAENLAAYADMQVVMEMDVGSHTARWDAEFVRFTDRVDSETRTIGAVVALDRPFAKVIPGKRPPLSKGMFVKVRLVGRKQPQRLVVPRNAVRNGRVMLVDGLQRLAIVPVEILYSQDDISVIESGVEAGQQLVVTDLVPAVVGMRLQPQRDEGLERQLQASAGGQR